MERLEALAPDLYPLVYDHDDYFSCFQDLTGTLSQAGIVSKYKAFRCCQMLNNRSHNRCSGLVHRVPGGYKGSWTHTLLFL